MKKLIFGLCFLISGNLFAQRHYTNPILSGFYPDPSICRVGEDYYLVTSSFAYFPGLPIMHSKDLVSWHQIGHAMNRKSQLDLTGAGVSRGLFAPSITWHDSLFYITCTHVDKGGNFVITAKDPRGPWSEPMYLPEVKGIDPSLYFEGDKAYILYNSTAPDDKPLYEGHRTIRMYSFDWKNLKVSGEEKILVNGGSDLSKKPVWIEAPHILKKDSWYYLYCAEGGTSYQHSEVAFRSRTVEGPYTPNPDNPILTQRDLDSSRSNPVTSTGHAEIFQTLAGEWYAVFLGCRPYSREHYNTGRETFMTPVSWINEWPVINPGFKEIQNSYPAPLIHQALFTTGINEFAGDQVFLDHFDTKELNNRYSFLRTPSRTWHNFKDKKGYLSIELLPETCAGANNIAMVADRQNHLAGQVSTRLRFQTQADHEKAGLLIFQNENHYYFLCKSADRGQPVVQLYKGPGNRFKESGPELLTSIPLKKNNAGIIFKVEVGEGGYSFYFSLKKDKWLLVRSSVEREFLSTQTAGGFTGVMYGLYATSTGQPSVNRAMFDWFEKIGL